MRNLKITILILSVLFILFTLIYKFEENKLLMSRNQYFRKNSILSQSGSNIKIAIFDTSNFMNEKKESKLCFSETNSVLGSTCNDDCDGQYSECEHSLRVTKIIKDIAPNSQIYNYNISSKLQNGKKVITINNFINSLKDLKSKRIDILNLSFSFNELLSQCEESNFELNKILLELKENMVEIFASTGNDYQSKIIDYPSCLPFVNSVSSLNKDNYDYSDFANRNEKTKYFAISKYLNDENGDLFYGTSFSTAIASGTQALLFEKNRACLIKESKILDLDIILQECKK